MAVVHYYGAIKDTPDHRDSKKTYSSNEFPLFPQHQVTDLSIYVHHIYDQNDLGSCTANAFCAAYGIDLVKQRQTGSGSYEYFDPSRLFLYYNTLDRQHCVNSDSDDSGASIRETAKAMNCKGVCKESDWPYVTRKFKTRPPESCYVAAVGNNLCKYERLEQDINHMRACLKNDDCPFVFGFKVYSSFHNIGNQDDRPIPSQKERQNKYSMHAVVAVGYDDSRKRVKVLNSWGAGWGDSGYFYMPYDFITDSDLCFDFWKITFACERGKPLPKDTVECTDESGGSGYSASCGGGGGACGYGGGGSYYG